MLVQCQLPCNYSRAFIFHVFALKYCVKCMRTAVACTDAHAHTQARSHWHINAKAARRKAQRERKGKTQTGLDKTNTNGSVPSDVFLWNLVRPQRRTSSNCHAKDMKRRPHTPHRAAEVRSDSRRKRKLDSLKIGIGS